MAGPLGKLTLTQIDSPQTIIKASRCFISPVNDARFEGSRTTCGKRGENDPPTINEYADVFKVSDDNNSVCRTHCKVHKENTWIEKREVTVSWPERKVVYVQVEEPKYKSYIAKRNMRTIQMTEYLYLTRTVCGKHETLHQLDIKDFRIGRAHGATLYKKPWHVKGCENETCIGWYSTRFDNDRAPKTHTTYKQVIRSREAQYLKEHCAGCAKTGKLRCLAGNYDSLTAHGWKWRSLPRRAMTYGGTPSTETSLNRIANELQRMNSN